jgi:hypothetical protein
MVGPSVFDIPFLSDGQIKGNSDFTRSTIGAALEPRNAVNNETYELNSDGSLPSTSS